jgi:hypothetical protein
MENQARGEAGLILVSYKLLAVSYQSPPYPFILIAQEDQSFFTIPLKNGIQ